MEGSSEEEERLKRYNGNGCFPEGSRNTISANRYTIPLLMNDIRMYKIDDKVRYIEI